MSWSRSCPDLRVVKGEGFFELLTLIGLQDGRFEGLDDLLPGAAEAQEFLLLLAKLVGVQDVSGQVTLRVHVAAFAWVRDERIPGCSRIGRFPVRLPELFHASSRP